MPNGLASLFNCCSPQENYELLPRPASLVRLVVIGATLSDGHWWASVDALANVTVRAVTEPDDTAEEWADIVWVGGTAVMGSANLRRVSRAAVNAGVQISARLNGRTRRVVVDIVDLTGLTTNLPIGVVVSRVAVIDTRLIPAFSSACI